MRNPAFAAAVLALVAASPATAATFTVTSQADAPDANPGNGVCNPQFGLPGVCTLRAAIMEANALLGLDSIELTAGQTYTLTRVGQDDNAVNGDLDITDSLTIKFSGSGPRPVVDGNGIDRVFHIGFAFVSMQGFDITGGVASLVNQDVGGAIRINSNQPVLLNDMRLYGNLAYAGGAVHFNGPGLTVRDSQLLDNESFGGSAIDSTGGSLVVERSSVFGNSNPNDGNGIAIRVQGLGALTVHNSTISSNLGYGVLALNSGDVVLRNSTIADNSSRGLSMSSVHAISVAVVSTVIAGNGQFDCDYDLQPHIVYDTDGYNLDSDGSCRLDGGATNLPETDARLTPLKARGGSTPVHWPRPDSPLIDSGHARHRRSAVLRAPGPAFAGLSRPWPALGAGRPWRRGCRA